ncbi:hypothetical protein BKA61DRAFT_660971 [Leptodontidium sp. MPI-SDFR-AT-0119]|nr:hypothetical protein BKA61DRAFT_660971 [Leptodontidium sp. MPI-SDFR-AT-0119]
MPHSRFADREERLATEGREKYRGTARIRLEALHFPRGEPWELDRKNIEKLKKCFEKGQCDRVTRNHIPAVIDQSQLTQALNDSSVSAERLLNNHDSPHPTLKFPAGFQAPHSGRARDPHPKRKMVDDADYGLKTALIEEYSNEKPPTAGEIYCKISQYRRERDLYSERRWWSHLSKRETRCLNGLFRHPELHTGFDDLLDLPGLWGGMRISTLNKMISMNFPEIHGQLASGLIFAAFSPEDRDTIIRLFATATPLTLEQSCPAFVSDDPAAAGVRCGFPDEEAHARDAKSLVIANLHAEVDEHGESVTSFFVRRSVYFTFFGRPSDTTTKRRSNPAPHTGGGIHVDLQQERLGALGGGRSVSGQGRPTPQEEARMAQERMAQDLWERNRLHERQASVEAGNNVREGGDASQPTQRNQRRGTHVNRERNIADGLARTSEQPEDPPQSSSPAADLEALVNSYQDLIRTDDVDSSAHGQPSEQNPDRQLQIIPPSSMVRIEFKIYERDVWRTDRSLLVDSSDPSEVERVAKNYMRKHIRPFDSSLNPLVPRTCFQAAIADGSNTILLVPENSIQVNNQLVKHVPDAMSTEAG